MSARRCVICDGLIRDDRCRACTRAFRLRRDRRDRGGIDPMGWAARRARRIERRRARDQCLWWRERVENLAACCRYYLALDALAREQEARGETPAMRPAPGVGALATEMLETLRLVLAAPEAS